MIGKKLLALPVLVLLISSSVSAEQIPVFLYSSPLAQLRLTSGFGERIHPILKMTRHHNGVDFAAPVGAPIYAVLDGRIAYSDKFGRYGKLVVIIHSDGTTSHYAHCSSVEVTVGSLVKRGDMIAKVGKTGKVTGSHLHFEVRVRGRPVDPEPYFRGYF